MDSRLGREGVEEAVEEEVGEGEVALEKVQERKRRMEREKPMGSSVEGMEPAKALTEQTAECKTASAAAVAVDAAEVLVAETVVIAEQCNSK